MSALLFGNGTNLVHWKPSPTTRGTFDILSTCLITMLLCVWTAVHLNISPPGSVWRPRLRKVGWLVLALLAPEMVAYTAWYQKRQALSIMREANKACNLPNPPSWHAKKAESIKKAILWLKSVFMSGKQQPTRQPTLEAQKSFSPEDRHPWTMVHGFYALMGGLAFTIPENLSESKRFLPYDTSETWFVGDHGISLLLQQKKYRDVIPDLSEEEIKSKSKANGLAKALVCIQALWFIAQCLTRLAHRIPISLLELNTFGHAICALLIYFLWWEKPFEVDYPTIIQSQFLWDLRALDWMLHNRSSAVESFQCNVRACLEDDQWFQTLPEQTKQSFFSDRLRVERDLLMNTFDHRQDHGNYEVHSEQEKENDRDNKSGLTILAPGQYIQGTHFKARNFREFVERWSYSSTINSFDAYQGSHPRFPNISLTDQEVTRWKMAWRAVQLLQFDEPATHKLGTLVQRCQDWAYMDDIFELPIALGFSAAAFIYGGLHALAWSAHFDTSTEQLLWRISACVVMGGVPVILGPVLLQKELSLSLSPRAKIYGFVLIWTDLLLLTYILARGYLVVECFINLSHLPAGVYDVPTWSTYFPHIS